MNINGNKSLCPLCGGQKKAGVTTYSVDVGTGVVVVRHVHAMICEQCGEEWIDNETAQKLEVIVEEARAKRHEVEVVTF